MRQGSAVMYPRMTKKGPFTVSATGYEPIEGETVPRRHPEAKDKLVTTPEQGVTTLFDIVKRGSEKFGNGKAIGYRTLIREHNDWKKVKKVVGGVEQEVDKKWAYFELSEYNYMSFIEYERLVLQIGAGYRYLGLKAEDRVHIFANTSPFWLAISHGAVSQSMPIVTSYDTLGEEGLRHSLLQTRTKAIFLDPHLLPVLVNPLKEAKEIKYVFYNSLDNVKHEHIEELKKEHEHLTILSFEELRKLGEENPVEPVPPTPDDLCCIMYTSGATGMPKGVPLKHRNVVAAITGLDITIGPYVGPGDTLLNYLPLAHILEYLVENACFFWGVVMGYGNPRTLQDNSTRNCKGDIREFKPTVMVGVPAIWENVKKGIITKIDAGSPIMKSLFWGALFTKEFLMSTGLPGVSILDSVVFKKVRVATGGRLRFCINGAGPIARDTQHFISMTIAPMMGGYGLTETSGMGALCDPSEWTSSALGSIPGCIEVKLVDFPDAGYFAKSNPPQGEIWIRGPSVMTGYYQSDGETKEALTEDEWFKTGDIGEWDKNGHLRIIDRKKNLVKTLNGEYIALEKLESIYRAAAVVANICACARQDKAKPIAIIVPSEPVLKTLATDNGIQSGHLEALVHNDHLKNVVLMELQAIGRKRGLRGIEIVEGVVLVEEEWNPRNGLTTSTQKLNRRLIMQKYQREVDKAYSVQS